MDEIVSYEHHGQQVFALESLAGKHWQHCLCYRCSRFCKTDPTASCPTANALYNLCVEHGLAAPVYECPRFIDAAAAGPEY